MLHILPSTIKNNYNVITEAGKYWEILFKQCKQYLLNNSFTVLHKWLWIKIAKNGNEVQACTALISLKNVW